MKILSNIAVFCASTYGKNPNWEKVSKMLGKKLAENDISLIYGGGNRGLMGCVAESCFENGGKVIGVLPEFFNNAKVVKKKVQTEQIIVKSMHERKKMMYDLSDAFIALPGGIGTMEEIFEVFTWKQIGLHNKPVGLLNIDGYYDDLLSFLDKMEETGFLAKEVYGSLCVSDDLEELLTMLKTSEKELPSKLD